MAELLIVQMCEFLDDGDGHYRLHEPSRQLSQAPGVWTVDCHHRHRLASALARSADVLVLPFFHDWDFFSTLEERRAAGQVTVFEANDDFFHVQPWSPVARHWQDRAVQEQYRLFMAAADAVQTSTAELARRWQPMARRVAVFENQLSDLPPLAAPPDRPLTIGWGGSPGHFADWYHVAPYLERWLIARPQVRLAVMTNEFARPFFRLPPERYAFAPFGPMERYRAFLGTLDIGLAPLLPTPYNRGRSDVKFLEYAAHGVAGIYADLEPYRGSVVHGQTGLLYQTIPELLAHLDRLADDAALRQSIRERAYDFVAKHRRSADRGAERLTTYRSLLPGPPRGGPPAPEVFAAAQTDGRYLQLRPQKAEQTLLAAQGKPPAEAVPLLRELVRECPDYLAPLLVLGRMLNELSNAAAAQAVLERALALAPRSAAALAEIGRSWFLSRDVAAARRCLEQALTVNPLYYPGWLYLLRLLSLCPSPDGVAWAERAHQTFPSCYSLAWLAARVSPGPEAVGRLHRFLDRYRGTFTADEQTAAAPAFSRTVLEVAGPYLDRPEALALVQRACEVFPLSARLADLLARALHLAGRPDEAHEQFARALALRRTAVAFKAEYPEDDGALYFWQFGDTIRYGPSVPAAR